MENDQRRKLRSRKPLCDLRNVSTRLSSRSSSSSSCSALNKPLNKSIKSSTATVPSNNVTTASIDLNFPTPPAYSTPSATSPSSSSWVSGIDDELWEHSSVYSRRKTSDKSKNKKKAVPEPMIITPIPEGKREEIERNNLGRTSKTTPKKRHASEQALPQDFIEKQRAYFHEIDSEPLSVEEIESDAELEC